MFAGSFFRIKAYMLIGFSGLILDVISIFYKLIVKLDRTYRMTTMGIILLLIGATLVNNAAYYKTKKFEIYLMNGNNNLYLLKQLNLTASVLISCF